MTRIHQLIQIFCEIDDFCNELDEYAKHKLLPGDVTKRGPDCGLSVSEIMTILIVFQMSGYRNFKTFYCEFLSVYWKQYFPKLPSYQRFVELIKRPIFALVLFTQIRSGKRTGIYYVDSSCLPVCHIKRSKRHKTFEEIAKYGKTSIGWVFGLKLHLVTNQQGELIAFRLTKAHRSDIKSAPILLRNLKGLAFGDKAYIGKKTFEELFKDGLKLITRKRKGMKNVLQLNEFEQQMLNQRNIIETVIDHLKHHYQVWHTRHRSVINALTHLAAALAAYVIEPLKISALKLLAKTQN